MLMTYGQKFIEAVTGVTPDKIVTPGKKFFLLHVICRATPRSHKEILTLIHPTKLNMFGHIIMWFIFITY
jgi:hypothetical protein